MRYLSSISLALIALMALACTATPAEPTPTPTPTPRFSDVEVIGAILIGGLALAAIAFVLVMIGAFIFAFYEYLREFLRPSDRH